MEERTPERADALLINETLSGDEAAFAELVRRYQNLVWRSARRILGNAADAEDAVQEVFLRVFTSLRRYNSNYPFHCWIKRIAANHCIDQLRGRKLRRCESLSDMDPHEQEKVFRNLARTADLELHASDDPEAHERVVLSLIHNLKPRYRTAFVLRELEGWAYPDIARELGVAEAGARARVCRARAEVQRRFRQHLASMRGAQVGGSHVQRRILQNL